MAQAASHRIFSSLCEKSAISLAECRMTREKSPWMAILGAGGTDAAGSDPIVLKHVNTFC
ncbi:MAG: hypothetical protein K2H52_06610 [Lachnospiraceae bacterium]|nr:hypothetical protein [Lachnospiraceae bacterium]